MKNLKKTWTLMAVLSLTIACGGSGGSSSDSAVVPVSSDTLSVTVSGADTQSCTVYGENGRELGAGSPDNVEYEVGMEESVIVECGDLSSVMSVGDETVTLSDDSTVVANALLDSGVSLGSGSRLLASVMTDVQANFSDSTVNLGAAAIKSSSSVKALASTDVSASTPVVTALADFMSALSAITSPTSSTTTLKQNLFKLLVNMGEPFLVQTVGGTGSLISACNDSAVASISSFAHAINATSIGLTGCVVYLGLDSITDMNNPLGAPAWNETTSWRSLIRETGVFKVLTDSYLSYKIFDLASLKTFLFSSLAHTAYTQDEDGNTTTATLSETNLRDFLNNFFGSVFLGSTPMSQYKFHVPYNPSGGWEVNVVATLQSLGSECTDSDPDTVCSVTPLRFSISGSSAVEDVSGSYFFRATWNGTDFNDTGNLIDATTGKPYRDSNYHVVDFTLTDINTNYSIIDYDNKIYDPDLDPMCDGSDPTLCAPFSNSDWQALYPSYDNVDNAFQFPTPELTARYISLMQARNYLGTSTDTFKKLSAIEAYALLRLFERGIAATATSTDPAFIVDHDLTLSAWETATNNWLKTGTSSVLAQAGGSLNMASNILVNKTVSCWTPSGTFTCSLVSTIKANPVGTANSAGGTDFSLTGSITITSGPLTATYTPTIISISPDQKTANLLGDNNFTYSFHGTGLATKISRGSTINTTYSSTMLKP